MRRKFLPLFFLPVIVIITSLACGSSTSSDTQPRSSPTPYTASPALSTEVEVYLSTAKNAVETIGGALATLSELTNDPKLDDQDWKMLVATQATAIELSYQNLLKLTPPTELANFQSVILDAASDCKTGKDYFLDGIDNLNTDSLETATGMIGSCGAKMREARTLLDSYAEGKGTQTPSQEISDQDKSSQGKATVNAGANLRAGPGTNYAKVGGAKKGDTIELVAKDETDDWYELASGVWIAAFLVDNAPTDLPVTSDISLPARSGGLTTPEPQPTPEQPAQPYAECDCSGDVLNCDDFAGPYDAQACFNYCGGVNNDIHRLDRDGDGNACEWKGF